MHWRTLAGSALSVALAAVSTFSGAQAPQASPRVVLAVSEGTSGGTTPEEIVQKYRPLADVIGKALKMNVLVEPVRNFQRLEDGIRAKRYDLVMARPSDYPARGMRDFGYRYVANASPDGHCIFLVPKASAAKTLADLRGKRVVLPEKVSYMAQFCSAELRDAGFDMAKVQYMKEQEAVVFQMGQGTADIGGVASYSKAFKTIGEANLRELQRSRPQPYFPLIAGPKLTNGQLAALRAELIKMSATPAGKELVAKLGLGGFEGGGEKRLIELLNWLEKS